MFSKKSKKSDSFELHDRCGVCRKKKGATGCDRKDGKTDNLYLKMRTDKER